MQEGRAPEPLAETVLESFEARLHHCALTELAELAMLFFNERFWIPSRSFELRPRTRHVRTKTTRAWNI